MRKRTEPRHILDARQRITAAKRRVARQEKRVARIKWEGRNASRGEALLKTFVRRQQRSQQYLDMVVGWSRKHTRRKFPRALRNRFMGPRSARESEQQRRVRWDRDVRAFLDKQYPKAPNYKAYLLALWEKYLAVKLPTEHFVTQFTSGKKAVVFQRAWEMMVARHLDALGFAITTAPYGPDFRFEHGGRSFWVEAVSPEPMGVPEDYLEGPKPGEFKMGDVPHEEVRRRWIAAIKDKAVKLAGYRAMGIVGDDDVYVIAVNGCQLGALPIHHGVSQLPYAVEAVYPAGPIAIPVDKKTGAFGTPYLSNQWAIKSAQGKPVPTSMFVNEKYADVSCVIACTSDRSEDPILPLDVVHNHFAKVAVPRGLFGPEADEWVTEPDGKDGINVKKVEGKISAHQALATI
jgi:type I restriction enzyme S subunit